MSKAEETRESELRRLVDATINELIAKGQVVTKAWASYAVRKHITRPSGHEAWYWLECEGIAIDALIRQAIQGTRESEPVAPEQSILPGFERVQAYYSVVRDKERVLVPIDQMTADEVEAKKAEFRRNIDGLSKHLDEFTAYHERRFSKSG